MDEKEKDIKITESYNYCYEDKFEMEDSEGRRLYINCIIDESVVDTAVYNILRYNRMDKGVPAEERKPIIIYINSPGGSVIDGYSLIDAITLSKTPVYTVNLGACFSMGLLIYMAGHKRFAFPRSEFLLHEGFISDGDSVSKVKDYLDFQSNQVEVMTKDYILEHSKIGSDEYDRNMRKEWYFLPKEGKKIGIVDYILGEDDELDTVI